MADLRNVKLGEMLAVINGRTITLHRVIRVTANQFQVRIKGKQRHKFCKFTGADRSTHPNARIKAYRPTPEQAHTIRTELQCAALYAEALHMAHLITTLVRKTSHLPSDNKLATLRSVILYMGKALKRTNALLPSNAQVRPLDQGTSRQGDDHPVSAQSGQEGHDRQAGGDG